MLARHYIVVALQYSPDHTDFVLYGYCI